MSFTGLDLPFLGAPVEDNLLLENQLPVGGATAWPPLRFSPVAHDQKLWSAWWAGNPDRLVAAYSLDNGGNSPVARAWSSTTGEAGMPSGLGRNRPGLFGLVRRFFWGNITPEGERRTNYHIPLAGDIASTSASLLFGQPPSLKTTAGTETQDYLSGLVDDGAHSTLMESAEQAAALGGTYLRVAWDTDLSPKSWIDQVPADCAVPEFRQGRLVAVTFWSVIKDEGKDVVRHLEKHVVGKGVILHGVYHGNQKELGRQMALTDFPETAPISRALTHGNAIVLPDFNDASTVTYIPNMRPNRIWRELGPQAAPLGRSDFSGVEGLMDALDETMSSWMRDIRLGKARLIVPQSMLQPLGRGQGAILDLEREVMIPIGGLVTGEGDIRQQILPQQFNIRWQEHKSTCDALIEEIIGRVGYSGQTLGLQGDIAQTATEVVARERKSLTTRGKKINYWRPGYADVVYGQMAVDKVVFNSKITPVRPDVEFPDAVLPDQMELAQTVAALRGAESASIETAVAMVHPDWKPEDVALEVQRIYEEINIDLLSRAKIMIGGGPGESVAEDLSEIPDAIGATDVASQAEALANVSDMYGSQDEAN
jgi:A118 family predicted phage portal protein